MTLLDHFARLFDVETRATLLSLDALDSIPPAAHFTQSYDRAMRLMPHVLLARRVWLDRITATPFERVTDWFPRRTTAECRETLAQVDQRWAAYRATLGEDDLARVLEFQTSDGTRWSSPLIDIITHTLHHGVYHRGQIARLVSELGGSRPVTDHFYLTATRLS
jgi:uncharacterized damage-inducible protein DinB